MKVEKWVKQHEIITESYFIRMMDTEAIWEGLKVEVRMWIVTKLWVAGLGIWLGG